MDPPSRPVSFKRQGDLSEDAQVFHIETVLNNRMFGGPLSFLSKNEDDFTETDRLKYEAIKWTLSKTPRALRREVFMRVPSPYELIAARGRLRPTHDRTVAKQNEQNCVRSRPRRHPCSASVHLAVQRQQQGAEPAARAGDGLVLLSVRHQRSCARAASSSRTRAPQVRSGAPPEAYQFFNRIWPGRPNKIERSTRTAGYNPSYIEMYRRGNAYHGSHPCFMWYWGQRGREKTSRVIVVGADNATVPAIMGWETAGSIAEAIAMARSTMGRSAQITMRTTRRT
jgi:hypothetical protein